METAKDIADNLIDRARNMQKFRIVKLQPESFLFNGRVPFDLSIRDNLMTFTVYALNLAEANAIIDKYLDDNSATEW